MEACLEKAESNISDHQSKTPSIVTQSRDYIFSSVYYITIYNSDAFFNS
jgi:hypothetical protein